MKKIKVLWLFVLCLTVSTGMSAQLKIGVLGGMNASQVHGDGFATNGLKSGFQIDAILGYHTKGHSMYISGLRFIQRGGALRENGSPLGSYIYHQINPRLNYLEIPLKYGYDIKINNHCNLIPTIGVFWAHGISSSSSKVDYKYSFTGESKYPDIKYVSWNPYNNDYLKFNRNDFGLNAGLIMTMDKHVVISFEYEHGLKKLQSQLKTKDSSLMLSVGYLF
jgi:hypothetical protein